MTRARAKLLQAKVNSLLSLCDFDTPLDGLLLHNHAFCIIRYEEKNPQDGGAPADKTRNSLSPAVLPAPDPVGAAARTGSLRAVGDGMVVSTA